MKRNGQESSDQSVKKEINLITELGNATQDLRDKRVLELTKFRRIKHHLNTARECLKLAGKFAVNGKWFYSKTVTEVMENKDKLHCILKKIAQDSATTNKVIQNNLIKVANIIAALDKLSEIENKFATQTQLESVIKEIQSIKNDGIQNKSTKVLYEIQKSLININKGMNDLIKTRNEIQMQIVKFLLQNCINNLKEVSHIIKETIVELFKKNPKDKNIQDLEAITINSKLETMNITTKGLTIQSPSLGYFTYNNIQYNKITSAAPSL